MNTERIIDSVNSAATAIGYPILAVLCVLLVWLTYIVGDDLAKLIRERRYERMMEQQRDREFNDIRADWLYRQRYPLPEPVRYDTIDLSIDQNRRDTDVLTFTRDDLYNYQEDNRHGLA
jgi:hypothetical protein